MIVREILDDPSGVIGKFDFFNDFRDTSTYLIGVGGEKAMRVEELLANAYVRWIEENGPTKTNAPLELPKPAYVDQGAIDGDFFADWLINPDPSTVADLQGKLRWFARLANARREADENLEQIKAKMAELEPHLLEEMATAGLERQTVDGITIYPQTDLIVSKKAEKDGVTTEKLVDALRACGLSYMVSEGYSASSLKSKVKEWRDAGVEVPEQLAGLINVIDKPKLVTRKA